MPDAKITALASIGTGTDPANDPLVIVDVSDVAPGGMSATGTTKKVTLNNLLASGPAATLASVTVTGAATVGTTLGVTGAATFTGAVVCNGAVTLGDAVGDAVSITGSLTSYTGQNPSAIRAAASDYAAAAFDGATTSTRITSTLTGQNIGTGDFSVWARFRVPATAGSGRGIIQLSSSAAPAISANGFNLYIRSGGTIAAIISGAVGTDFRLADGVNVITTYAGQVIDVVFTRTGSTVAMYINGTSVALTDITGGTPPAWSGSITSTYCHAGAFDSNLIFSGRIYRSVVFNRALSASDVTELITTGVNPADQWGTQTQIWNTTTLNGGFETAGGGGADVFANWTEFTTGTAVLSRDTVDYSPDLGSTASAKALGTDGTSIWSLYNTPILVANKRYRLSVAHKRSANGSIPWKTISTNLALATFSVTTSWANYSAEFVMPTNEQMKVDGVGNNTVWIDNAILERIGAIVDLDFTVGAGYQATDRSTNNLHGTLFNGVEFTVPRRMAVLYATTSTAAPQQMLGSLAIPTNAIIEDIIVNSTGTATVTIRDATPSGSIIVNGASVVSGRQKLTIAQPFSSTGNLWVSSSTTAVLQFTILYTIAA